MKICFADWDVPCTRIFNLVIREKVMNDDVSDWGAKSMGNMFEGTYEFNQDILK